MMKVLLMLWIFTKPVAGCSAVCTLHSFLSNDLWLVASCVTFISLGLTAPPIYIVNENTGRLAYWKKSQLQISKKKCLFSEFSHLSDPLPHRYRHVECRSLVKSGLLVKCQRLVKG